MIQTGLGHANCTFFELTFHEPCVPTHYSVHAGAVEKGILCKDVERLHAQLLRSIDKDSSILLTFGKMYDKDAEPGVRHVVDWI